jgi:hypothetical protein
MVKICQESATKNQQTGKALPLRREVGARASDIVDERFTG